MKYKSLNYKDKLIKDQVEILKLVMIKKENGIQKDKLCKAK